MRTTRTASPCTKVSTSSGATACAGFDTRLPLTRTCPPDTCFDASERVLKNRACHSHLSRRMRDAPPTKDQPLVLSPIRAAAKGLSGSMRSFFSGLDEKLRELSSRGLPLGPPLPLGLPCPLPCGLPRPPWAGRLPRGVRGAQVKL